MPELDGAVATPIASEPVTMELGPDLSIYGDALATAVPDAPALPTAEDSADAPTPPDAEPPQAVAADAVPETVEAQLDGDDDAPITRRNARELVEKARAAERDALTRAQELETQQRAQQERWQTLQEQAAQWTPSPETYAEIDRAIKRRDWDALDRHGIRTLDEGLDRLEQMDQQRDVNTAMLGYWQQVFMANAGSHFKTAASWDGVQAETVLGEDMGAALKHLYDTGREQGETEWKGKYAALKAEYDALKGRAGAAAPSPETGGTTSPGGWTKERYQQAVRSGEADSWSADERDRITQLIWMNDGRGR